MEKTLDVTETFAKVSFAFLFFASHVTALLHLATRNYQRIMYDQIAFCLFDMSLAPTIYTDLNYFESTPCTHWQNVIRFFLLYKLLINITYLFLSLWGLYVSFTKNKQLRLFFLWYLNLYSRSDKTQGEPSFFFHLESENSVLELDNEKRLFFILVEMEDWSCRLSQAHKWLRDNN